MIRILFALIASASLAAAAPIPKESKKTKTLDGVWELKSMEVFGKPGGTPSAQRWKFADGNIVIENTFNAGIQARPPIGFVTDDTAAPKSLDYNTAAPTPRPAVYEVKDDTLKLVMNFRGNERPKSLASDDSTAVYVFQRVKE